MHRRLVLPLLAAAGLVFACGPRPRLGAERASDGSAAVRPASPAPRPHARRAADAPPVEAALAVRLDDGIRFDLAVANATDHRVELNFPDGHTREFVVFDDAGREVWRWSRGRLFTQTVQNRLLAKGDTVVYSERWDRPVPGRYTVVAQLRSENFPLTREARFDVPPAVVAHGGARRVGALASLAARFTAH